MIKDLLMSYKNIHKKEKCFIIATGPSINHANLNLLKNKYTFGCNTFYKHDFKANYFCVIDKFVWDNHKQHIIKKYNNIFCPFSKNSKLKLNKFLNNCSEQELMNYGNITKGIYRAHTVVGAILQITLWMGFDKVFLLGCDCNYIDGQHHFDGSKVDNYKRENWKEVFDCYEIAKKIYEKKGKKIYNCTNGGSLEVFERKKLENAAQLN